MNIVHPLHLLALLFPAGRCRNWKKKKKLPFCKEHTLCKKDFFF